MLWTAAFWKGAGERAIKTWAQAFLAAIAAMTLGIDMPGVEHVPWLGALSVATLAAFLSLLTSVGNAEFTAGAEPRRAAEEV